MEASLMRNGVRLSFDLFPCRGGLGHLAVNCGWRRLVDDRDLAAFDLDFPYRGPFNHLVVREVERIREFIAVELVRSRVGVHRIEQLDALLICHLRHTLRFRALLAYSNAQEVPVPTEDGVTLGRVAARLFHLTGIHHLSAVADQLPRPVEVVFGRGGGKRDSEEQGTTKYRGFHDVPLPWVAGSCRCHLLSGMSDIASLSPPPHAAE